MYQVVINSADGSPVNVRGADSLAQTVPGQVVATWEERPTDLITVETPTIGFSVWPDEISAGHPVVLPRIGLSVAVGDDHRSYADLIKTTTVGIRSAVEAIEDAAEESFASAAARSRELAGPIWLGLGRDFRTFGASYRGVGAGQLSERLWDWIAPQWHGEGVVLAEDPSGPTRYHLMLGRGISSQQQIIRRLRSGRLPVLEATIADGPLVYHATSWVGLETSPTTPTTNVGTNYLLADGHSAGHMFTPEQQAAFDRLQTSYAPSEETVYFLRVVVRNDGGAPRHAFVKLPVPFVAGKQLEYSFDAITGTSSFGADRVFAVATVDGSPAGREEISQLLQPGQSLVVDIRLPHRPIPAARAADLRRRDGDQVLREVTRYWEGRLDAAARISLPEQRITEMVAAGLLHLDLVSYGEEPNGTIAPTIGIYAPIGSESAPIIQFYDSIGQTDLARRSLQYFLDKQHDDGFIQNFGGYMLETEAALWSLGEHYRYTRDVDWVKQIRPNLEAAVNYILGNRERQAGSRHHGLIVGKTADPEDPFAAYMLNGYAALGLSRAAEMITELDPDLAGRWRSEADRLRDDIRASLAEAMANSPVVPLGNGSWSRTAPPWAGQRGPLALDRSGSNWFTHGSITSRDALLGPLWLTAQEVLQPEERETTELLDYHADLLFHDNAAFSQPYYSPHLLTHLRRGEVKQFLTPYYTMMAALADRQTYSFWEHYFHASPHKTHEEAWFLMQTRWMLYLEHDRQLRLLPGIPRAWLAPGEHIELDGVRSYFGPLDLTVDVAETGDRISVRLRMDATRAPEAVAIRLPHPDGPRTAHVDVGRYDTTTESVMLDSVTDGVELQLHWA